VRSPGALILTGYGINCDYETFEACRNAGFAARRLHINDLVEDSNLLFDHKLIVFPGGFSFGDDLGSGVAFAAKVRFAGDGNRRLYDMLEEYVEGGGLVLGICNGFQILVRLGLLPALRGGYGTQEVTLAPNREGYYIDRWVRLKVETGSPSIYTKGMKTLSLPVRHGEGRFLPRGQDTMELLERSGGVVLRYCGPDGCPTMKFPDNPNGSEGAVAGICDMTGRVFGLMPHPEAAVSFYQFPDWTKRKEEARRRGMPLSEEGDGFYIFKNALKYAAES